MGLTPHQLPSLSPKAADAQTGLSLGSSGALREGPLDAALLAHVAFEQGPGLFARSTVPAS